MINRLRRYDFLIVGAGFAGSVLAERLARGAGRRVLLIDRRPHIAGNAFDEYDRSGVMVHRYGPHIFHTNSAKVFRYLSRFTSWRPYEHRVRAAVDGKLLPIPINLDTVNQLYGLNLTSEECVRFFENAAERRSGPVETSEDVIVSKVGRHLYETFFRGYTRKQWGLDPSQLDASVTARIPTRSNRDDRYFEDRFQAMPAEGYTVMFERMLDHPNIDLRLETEYADVPSNTASETVFSGPIDEYFTYRYGPLPYRSLSFRFETLPRAWVQPVAVVNYPGDQPFTRVTEMKHLTGQQHPCTALIYEYPQAEGDPYYPVPCKESKFLYHRYRALAEQTSHVRFLGRLGTYKYYNMDQVVAQALALYGRIVSGLRVHRAA